MIKKLIIEIYKIYISIMAQINQLSMDDQDLILQRSKDVFYLSWFGEEFNEKLRAIIRSKEHMDLEYFKEELDKLIKYFLEGGYEEEEIDEDKDERMKMKKML